VSLSNIAVRQPCMASRPMGSERLGWITCDPTAPGRTAPPMDLVFQLISGIMSLTFMLIRFMFQLMFMVVRGVVGLLGGR
jgi:hypothetical protein